MLFIKVLVLGANMPKFALPEIANLQLIQLSRQLEEHCDGDMTQLHLRMTTGIRVLLENFLTMGTQVIYIYITHNVDDRSAQENKKPNNECLLRKSKWCFKINTYTKHLSIKFLSLQLCLKWTCQIHSRFEMVHTVARNTSFYNFIFIGDQQIHRVLSIQSMVPGM